MQNKRYTKPRLVGLFALLSALLIGLLGMPALAKAPNKVSQAKAAKAAKRAKVTKSWKQARARLRLKKNKKLRVGPVGVKGTRHVPKVLYFLGRSKVQYRNTRLKRGYLNKVIGSVGKKPF